MREKRSTVLRYNVSGHDEYIVLEHQIYRTAVLESSDRAPLYGEQRRIGRLMNVHSWQ